MYSVHTSESGAESFYIGLVFDICKCSWHLGSVLNIRSAYSGMYSARSMNVLNKRLGLVIRYTKMIKSIEPILISRLVSIESTPDIYERVCASRYGICDIYRRSSWCIRGYTSSKFTDNSVTYYAVLPELYSLDSAGWKCNEGTGQIPENYYHRRIDYYRLVLQCGVYRIFKVWREYLW